jgi:hypothetical protein
MRVGSDGLGIEDDDVGLPALRHPAPLLDAVELAGTSVKKVHLLQGAAGCHRTAPHLGGVVERHREVQVGASGRPMRRSGGRATRGCAQSSSVSSGDGAEAVLRSSSRGRWR